MSDKTSDKYRITLTHKQLDLICPSYLGPELPRVLTAVDVANMMILFKVARNTANFRKTDNWVDIAGYAACGGEISESVAADGD